MCGQEEVKSDKLKEGERRRRRRRIKKKYCNRRGKWCGG